MVAESANGVFAPLFRRRTEANAVEAEAIAGKKEFRVREGFRSSDRRLGNFPVGKAVWAGTGDAGAPSAARAAPGALWRGRKGSDWAAGSV